MHRMPGDSRRAHATSTARYHPAMEASDRTRIRIEAFEVARFGHPAGSPLPGRPGIVMAYAVVHPAGLLLFDTGIGTGDAEVDEAYHPVVSDLRSLLRERSLELDDVVALACSHLHFDHAGQNAAFPGRPIHVQAAERAAARAPGYTIDAWIDFAGARYVEEDGEVELLPGVRLVPTPGHTPGHQSLVVDSPEGRTVLVGQAVYTRAEWDGAGGPGVSGLESAWDPASYRSSVARLRALRPDIVLFGHDR
jgi:glyoxylase-like metal-dependent hydrolase (beta-lactamase superfamily II)